MKLLAKLQKWWMVFVILLIFFYLGSSVSPTSKSMFTFHDETQAARVEQFTQNLTSFHIPPRMAPEFSYGMGYPVFNFYAPFAYYVTSILNILGLSVIAALKTSFLLALLGAFLGMYLFLKELFDKSSALFGATLYITSSFIPVEIFVRGNLSEMWFIALFPITLFLLVKNSKVFTKKTFFLTTVFISFLLTSHNVFSLLSFLIVPLFISILANKKRNYLVFALGALMASYFIIPAVLESGLTYASTIATQTHFADNFLCIKQLWSSPWGFGGSTPGCVSDGMSFALGKPQIIFGLFGGVILLYNLLKRKQFNPTSPEASRGRSNLTIFVSILTVVSLSLSLHESQFIWNLFSPVLSLFQFPWRFLVFGVFGLAYLGAFGFFSVLFSTPLRLRPPQSPYPLLLSSILSVVLILSASFLYKGQSLPNTIYESKYLSENYVHNQVAYKIPEYLPKTADYLVWRSFENKNTLPYSDGQFVKSSLNIHYFPFWRIEVDGTEVIPTKFDSLGRPLLDLEKGSKVLVTYQQTTIEQFSNLATIITFFSLLGLIFYKLLWMKIQKIKN
ncbi:hypothetical protein A3D80_01010 [Candidatus Roizmanbacteria bacterium RIFCSPHIGHO2_02_FULL_40_13b]|uniref:Membrane protein 6-pyruvoyl-tetrahydropterin synthase-related domain-containing protein n=1 Tax=Candidatus Roizmanbacteria bacterium RIFCSPHIGHO2_01_FULL_39_24 TaxID=1802032 RepID=A0A1F7GJL2_9BACT|nr:MAG: hypothetical protein A2799_02375 [Candidatus Roizmanbacteria bacterium RIFCSPHIGHO2_01_FULL_39_24]OGK26275.1 MAG: hypothetical protein A3D80_01010 [Candidatus Roizmanbacteria bacterium RIFCSPHIGHO2_02_FULL_40_13b]OGK48910.1 MAG: hypothetical protein A3A56_01770 [Candidatus Roizmanbacteria bacterium RIFCSPLOWO2_01_FULL_40_32]